MSEQIEEPNALSTETTAGSIADPSRHDDEFARLLAENETLRAAARVDAARRQITSDLARAGARSPNLLFEAIKNDLHFAADENIENKNAVIEDLRTRFPEQFGTRDIGSVDGGAGRGSSPQLTVEALAKMSANEIAALDWNEVKNVLSGRR